MVMRLLQLISCVGKRCSLYFGMKILATGLILLSLSSGYAQTPAIDDARTAWKESIQTIEEQAGMQLKEIQAKYLLGLGKLKEGFTQKGDFKQTLAVKNELDRFSADKTLLDGHVNNTSPLLQKGQRSAIEQLEKLAQKKAGAINQSKLKFSTALKEGQKELVKAGDLDKATAIQRELDALANGMTLAPPPIAPAPPEPAIPSASNELTSSGIVSGEKLAELFQKKFVIRVKMARPNPQPGQGRSILNIISTEQALRIQPQSDGSVRLNRRKTADPHGWSFFTSKDGLKGDFALRFEYKGSFQSFDITNDPESLRSWNWQAPKATDWTTVEIIRRGQRITIQMNGKPAESKGAVSANRNDLVHLRFNLQKSSAPLFRSFELKQLEP